MKIGLLDDARRAVEPVLRQRVDTLPSTLRQRAVHHFGWDDPANGTGKAARPALWTVCGTTEALLAGNALCALGLETLADLKGVARLARCVTDLCEGQNMDIGFEQRTDVSLDECLTMSAGKTGVLLGIWGDERATGKPTGSDLSRLKKTLPVIRALESGSEAGTRLAELYAPGTELDAAQTRHATDLVARTGAREWAEAEIHRRVDLALAHVEKTGSPELASLARLAFAYYTALSRADA